MMNLHPMTSAMASTATSSTVVEMLDLVSCSLEVRQLILLR
jgi:hypothetical protein